MSYMALYRKWRPAAFEDVKGQEPIVRTLKNQVLSGRVGHAYLFCGTRGTGKTSIAKIFARAVNCEHPVDGSPCNECAVCRAISAGSSLNVVEIDAASNNGVDNIREIREQVEYPPTEGKYRVYIIDEVHMLSTGAFNALLKTLEEPPSYVIFILATTEVHKIPITVLSRCQRYDFKRISMDTIVDRLREMVQAEGIDVEEKALRFIAKAGDGSMRDSISLLEQCVAFHFGETLTYEFALDVLGAVDTSVFSRLLRALIAEDAKESIRILEEMIIQGRELSQFVTDFIWYLRNLMMVQNTTDAEDLLDVSAENMQALKEEAVMVPPETLMRYIRVLSELLGQIRYASQKRVLIEVALIRLTRPEMEQNLDSVLDRVARMEEKLQSEISRIQMGISAGNMPSGNMPVNVSGQGGILAQNGAARYAAAGLAANEELGYAVPMNGGIEPVSENRVDYENGIGSVGSVRQQMLPPRTVELPKAQLDDLNFIRNEWGKIVRDMGMSIRPSFRETVLEPSGDSCLCIVFMDETNYRIGSRPVVLGDLERYVEEKYQKKITFKTRLGVPTEVTNTFYVTREEMEEKILTEITIEDEMS
ncbi:MAG: DNA polymerase III subunit gamma/tau [bacterium]|nr:DNA polymerase III subunit gamma/tau [bacterium]